MEQTPNKPFISWRTRWSWTPLILLDHQHWVKWNEMLHVLRRLSFLALLDVSCLRQGFHTAPMLHPRQLYYVYYAYYSWISTRGNFWFKTELLLNAQDWVQRDLRFSYQSEQSSDMGKQGINLVKTEINEATGTCSLHAKWKILLLSTKITYF